MFSLVLPQLSWAVMGWGRLSSVMGCGFGQGLTQALPGFSTFCLTGLFGCFNVGLLFIGSFPNSLLRPLTLSSNFISVLGSTALVLRFCC